ncbi:3-deoxy-7-phosphoheptulonate synthase [Saprolegnia parasitica CBS 223.65]|uniref:3-deoxy-7-phosphoheptulonate synthase n=1 Tax=Saprolegnia parasitica (strain CBS 223.65) TaxID=695850 RepID=A0A067BRR6_SAPPC|nr:3-deoxy-7-phosphoheptulonate synthase [Saprolegnia parasitica CBS 223.65]KDO17001.1 3-deoxy-7-phosphoheptulonate synthase [Saprolegnia parasitica CBS 223.65]|eukprot:XP_012212290.1 3-deoxy-7-phosphoheptulonate synthase [Saprolegnia parasitica CBS 223.65]
MSSPSPSANTTLLLSVAVAALTLAWGGTMGLLLGLHLQQQQQPASNAESKDGKRTVDNQEPRRDRVESRRGRETSITNGEDVKLMDKHALVDVRIAEIRPLLPPACLLEEIPRTVEIARTVNKGRQGVANILRRVDDRLVVVVGPCSIHDVEAAKDYATKLKPIQEAMEKDLLIIMRVYFEKPRTTVGWKGLINDPDIDGTFNINKGLRVARELLAEINEMGLPAGCEFLDTISPQFFCDLVSWGAIGARTTECQLHRELTSGLSMPIGFKNGTGGSLQLAVDAVVSSGHPHCFLSVSSQSLAAIVKTTGNDCCHVILRGGSTGPNYAAEHVEKVSALLKKVNQPQNVMVDCSHGNSNKDHKNQPLVAADLARQIAAGDDRICGIMLESNIVEGAQKLIPNAPLVYGQSITDACIGWEDTLSTLEVLADAVRQRRAVHKATK